jgi:hypothetical protein
VRVDAHETHCADQENVMTNAQDAAARAARRTEMESVLAKYPHLSEEQLTALVAWFRKEASALDVATMASNPDVADNYRSFRTDHIDPITRGEWIQALLIILVVIIALLVVFWRAF